MNTGRMPMAAQGAQAPAGQPVFTEEEAEWLGAYIEYLGGGAGVPDDLEILVADADTAEGGDLYRVNCSSCHGFAGGGGALSSGAHAPGLQGVSDEELYQAMLTGPQNMPVFADNELTLSRRPTSSPTSSTSSTKTRTRAAYSASDDTDLPPRVSPSSWSASARCCWPRSGLQVNRECPQR
ncbi:hypothetical protein GCM10029992_39470 [Glycomyces albus]